MPVQYLTLGNHDENITRYYYFAMHQAVYAK